MAGLRFREWGVVLDVRLLETRCDVSATSVSSSSVPSWRQPPTHVAEPCLEVQPWSGNGPGSFPKPVQLFLFDRWAEFAASTHNAAPASGGLSPLEFSLFSEPNCH